MIPHPDPRRRALLRAGALSVPAALTTRMGPAAAVTQPATQPAPAPPIRGGDISFTLQLERAGVSWSVDGRNAPLERLLRGCGMNWVRLRVWVDPPQGYSTVESALVLARRAKAAGHRVLLDLHYSDFWADPAHQDTPADWADQDLPTLARTVRGYTRSVLERFSIAGCPVDMVQVGNEITAGMLWPLGKIYTDGEPDDWRGFTRLLRAAVAGAREARVRGPKPRVMVHIDRGGDNAGARWFFDHVLARGVEPDVIGLSYYPFWHGPIDALEANLVDLGERYGRDLVVVETAYPWTLRNGDDLDNFIVERDQLPDWERWPATQRGQEAYFRALRARLRAGAPRPGPRLRRLGARVGARGRVGAGRGQPERQPHAVRLAGPRATRARGVPPGRDALTSRHPRRMRPRPLPTPIFRPYARHRERAAGRSG